MPYEVRKCGTEYCAVNKKTGRVLGTHATKDAAAKQIYAVNVSEGHIPNVKPRQRRKTA